MGSSGMWISHPGSIDWTPNLISSPLQEKGMNKNCDGCLHLLQNMQDLHWILCKKKPRSQPLFSPHRKALYGSLGHFPGFPDLFLLYSPYILLLSAIKRHNHWPSIPNFPLHMVGRKCLCAGLQSEQMTEFLVCSNNKYFRTSSLNSGTILLTF